jgi:hypothetical protein
VLRWLTRLFRQREAAETASPASPPPPASQAAVDTLTASSATGTLDRPTEATGPAVAEPEKETCPTCGRTSVFAGPPGQRFCTYCALRDELFEARAAASE